MPTSPAAAAPYGRDEFGLDIAPASGGFPAAPTTGGYAGPPADGGYPAAPAFGGYPAQPGTGDYFASSYPPIEPSPPPQRRILPLPAPPPRRIWPSLVGGLLAGALVAGTAAFFVGRATVDAADPVPVVAAQPPAITELIEANRASFPDDLLPVAQPWLADMSDCVADTDSDGPTLDPGQRSHVLCRDGGMYLHFVAYVSADAKAADLSFRRQIALNSSSVLPGADQPDRKLGGVTGVGGTYVEYAVRAGEDPALCGVWWSPDDTDTAVYVDVLCDSLGGEWEPLRAVWQRHS
ncbi:hypothetical protein [Solwaraspora sp. WMMA2101]|uniref:hypothetical protein n=1 Tax=Solwaraspora sp. WMMA2101 TaxID=3404124 RepID=UPI003B965773